MIAINMRAATITIWKACAPSCGISINGFLGIISPCRNRVMRFQIIAKAKIEININLAQFLRFNNPIDDVNIAADTMKKQRKSS